MEIAAAPKGNCEQIKKIKELYGKCTIFSFSHVSFEQFVMTEMKKWSSTNNNFQDIQVLECKRLLVMHIANIWNFNSGETPLSVVR